MADYLTSSTLIASVKRRAMIPENQSTFTDDDFLEFANEEMSLGLLPSILRTRENYLLFQETVPLESNKSAYDIPYRAIGNKLRNVQYVDSSGGVSDMTQIQLDDIADYSDTSVAARLAAFYILNNQVVVVPKIGANAVNSLLLSYYIKPNKLVLESESARIKSINTTTGAITLSQIPSSFTLLDDLGAPRKYDLIQTKAPFKNLKIDLIPGSLNVSTKVIQFNPSDLPADLSIGDYVNLAGESCIPQIPSDLHVVLAHRVAARCLEALGDAQGLQLANQKLAEMEANTQDLINNRVEDAPKKIVNRYSHLRWGMSRRNFRIRR